MIFELMSDGRILRLPDNTYMPDIPSYLLPKVVLYLPYSRMIVGSSGGVTMDSWFYGKIASEKWKEIFLYDGEKLMLKEAGIPDIEIPAKSVTYLKGQLLEQLRPPGSHISTLMVLRSVKKDLFIFNQGNQWTNENWVIEKITSDDVLRIAYWGIRKALLQNSTAMLERIKLWFISGLDIQSFDQYPQMWFSLTDLPSERDFRQIERLGFSRDNLMQMNTNFSNPVILSSSTGYLVLLTQYSGDDYSELRVWMYLSEVLWEEMRRKKKMSVREIVGACWGYLDALEAEHEMSKYGRLRKSVEVTYENGSVV